MVSKICKCCGKKRLLTQWDNFCPQCLREKARDAIVEAIQDGENEVDTGSSDYIICPYCGDARDTDYGAEDFPELYEEGDHEIECYNCGRTFVLNSSCYWYYETRKKED